MLGIVGAPEVLRAFSGVLTNRAGLRRVNHVDSGLMHWYQVEL